MSLFLEISFLSLHIYIYIFFSLGDLIIFALSVKYNDSSWSLEIASSFKLRLANSKYLRLIYIKLHCNSGI